jgi:hypothetical protein
VLPYVDHNSQCNLVKSSSDRVGAAYQFSINASRVTAKQVADGRVRSRCTRLALSKPLPAWSSFPAALVSPFTTRRTIGSRGPPRSRRAATPDSHDATSIHASLRGNATYRANLPNSQIAIPITLENNVINSENEMKLIKPTKSTCPINPTTGTINTAAK